MKVDMSPKAVKVRLEEMNDLWLLSVKLMNSKKIKTAKDSKNELPNNARDQTSSAEKRRI
jgi:stalled ribosome rescue protein Dom34